MKMTDPSPNLLVCLLSQCTAAIQNVVCSAFLKQARLIGTGRKSQARQSQAAALQKLTSSRSGPCVHHC